MKTLVLSLRAAPFQVLFLVLLALVITFTSAGATETSSELLLGRYKGEWTSYSRNNVVKMELEITSISPLKGVLYKTTPLERSHFADVKGKVGNGKISLDFVGQDGAVWDFGLSIKGRVLEGNGRGYLPGGAPSRGSSVNLRLEKVD